MPGRVELVPCDGRRDRRTGGGARAVRRREGLVDRTLGVVEPRLPAPLAHLPPPAHEVRDDGPDRARDALHPRAGLVETGPRRDRHPHLDAPPPGQLGLGQDAEVREGVAVQAGEQDDVVPRGSRSGVDVDEGVGRPARFGRARRPRVPLERPEVGGPHERGRLVDDEVGPGLAGVGLGVVPPGQPAGRVVGQLLVPEAVRGRPVGKPVQVQRPAPQVGQGDGSDPRGVPDELPLRDRLLARTGREQLLVEVGEPQPAPEDLPVPGGPQIVERGQLVLRGSREGRRAELDRRLRRGQVRAPDPLRVGLHLLVGPATGSGPNPVGLRPNARTERPPSRAPIRPYCDTHSNLSENMFRNSPGHSPGRLLRFRLDPRGPFIRR